MRTRRILAGALAAMWVGGYAGRADDGVAVGGIVLSPGKNDLVQAKRSEWAWVGGEERFPVLSVTLGSGRMQYMLRHDQKYGNGTLGLMGPSWADYRAEFSLMINGKRYELLPAHDEKVELSEGGKGTAAYSWADDVAAVRCTFALPAGDDRLFIEVQVEPKAEVKALEFRTVRYVPSVGGQPVQVVHTPVRRIDQAGDHALDPLTENAVFLGNETLDPEALPKTRSNSALAFTNADLVGVSVQTGGGGIGTVLKYKPSARRFGLCLYDFPPVPGREPFERFRATWQGAVAALNDPATFAADGGAPTARQDVTPAPSAESAPAAQATPTGLTDAWSEENVRGDVVTPHVEWAKPSAQGRLKVVVLAPAWGQRETVELMQRFDVECTVLMTHTSGALACAAGYTIVPGLAPQQLSMHYDTVLAGDWDALVIGGFNWPQLLLEHRVRILEKVHAGAGLVYVAPPKNAELDALFATQVLLDAATLVAGLPWAQLTAFKDKTPESVVSAGSFGTGRWVRLGYGTNSTNQSLTPALVPCPAAWEYEYYQSLLGKVIAWAAGKAAPLAVTERTLGTLTRSSLPAKATVTVEAHNAHDVTVATWFHRLRDGAVLPGAETKATLTAGTTPVALEVPLLAAGNYVCNLALKDEQGRTLAWFSLPLSIGADLAVNSVALEKDSFGPTDPITGAVSLSRALQAGETLTIGLWDNHGRLLREVKKTDGGEAAVRFDPVVPLDTNIHFLRATVTDAKGEMAAGEVEFSIRGRRRPDFHHATWQEHERDHISALLHKRFRALCLDTSYYNAGHRGLEAQVVARADLFGAPGVAGRFGGGKSEPGEFGPIHKNCLHDPEYLQKGIEGTLQSVGPYTKYEALFYPTGSDCGMGGNCYCPRTLEAFRKWLEGRYGTIEELNRVWVTSYAAWPDVVPDTYEKAKDKGSFTSWVELTRFMEQTYVEHHQAIIDALKTVDPAPLMGEDGYGRLDSHDGADWWQLLKVFGFYNLYTYQDPPQLEITRSLAPYFPNVRLRSIYYGSYTGQYGNLKFMRLIPWYTVLHGYNGLFWWIGDGKATYGCDNGAIVGPDFRPTLSFATSAAEIAEIRNGVVQLLARAQRLHNGIGIFYDQTAVHAVTAYSHPSHLRGAYQSFQDALEDLGLEYNYVAAPQIEAGILATEGYKVLILAHALALSEKTATAISQFVNAGGMLIADTMPAKYDYYLRPAGRGSLLADVLGAPGELKSAGAGWSVVLAEPFETYSRERYKPKGKELRTALAAQLSQAQLKRGVTVTGPDATVPGVAGLEVVSYAQAGNRYLGVMNNGGAGTVRLGVPEPREVYDVRAGKHLGKTNDWEVAVAEGETKLFALLPEPVGGVDIRGPTDALKPGARCEFNVGLKGGGATPSIHTFAVTVTDAQGRVRPEYGQILATNDKGEAATGIIPLALNDPAGKWQVTATETVTKAKATAEFVVAPTP